MQKPESIPLYIHRLKASRAYREMKDFQFAWYMKLLIESCDSTRPGMLPNDVDVLWTLAGSRTKAYFQREGQSVLDCFQGRTADGHWIFNERLIEVLEEQDRKCKKTKSEPNLDLGDSSSLVFDFKILVLSIFCFYVKTFNRDTRYKLTPLRAKKCSIRIKEIIDSGKSKEDAEAMCKEAILALAQSHFHVSNGYIDWIDHIFKSQERFQKTLLIKPKGPDNDRIQRQADVTKNNFAAGARALNQGSGSKEPYESRLPLLQGDR